MATHETAPGPTSSSLIERILSHFISRIAPSAAPSKDASSRLAATLPADCFSAVYRTKR